MCEDRKRARCDKGRLFALLQQQDATSKPHGGGGTQKAYVAKDCDIDCSWVDVCSSNRSLGRMDSKVGGRKALERASKGAACSTLCGDNEDLLCQDLNTTGSHG